MSLLFEFSNFMAEKIKPGFESGKIKDLEEVYNRIYKFLNKWQSEKRKNEICYGVHESLYAVRDVIDRLNILLAAIDGSDTSSRRPCMAFIDISRDVLTSEIRSLIGIIEDLNRHFPDQAIELED